MAGSAEIRKKIAGIAVKRAALERQVGDASRRQAVKNTEHAKRQGQALK